MRIMMITGEYPPMEGGVGDFTRQISRALHDRGHEIHVLTSEDPEQPEEEERDRTIIHRALDSWSWVAHNKITQWIDTLNPDVVNIQYQAAAYQLRGSINLFPRWQGRHMRIPIVSTFHDLRPPYLFPKAGALRQWAITQMAAYSDGVIVTNGEDYNELSERLKDEELPRMRLIHIGSNIAPHPPDGYHRGIWRTQHNIAEDALLVGFFGFLNESKGIETLLKAVHQLRKQDVPAQLIFIGGRTGTSDVTNIAYAEKIDGLIEELALTDVVQRTGFVPPQEVSAALLATDVCALPYRDGVSLWRGTLHACLVHGCAIVTTEPKGEVDRLEPGVHVLTVPPEEPVPLAEKILRLWENPDLRAELSEYATTLAEEFSWERIAVHTEDFYQELTRRD